MTNKLFVKDRAGNYSTRTPVSKQQLIDFAHTLTVPDFIGNRHVSSAEDAWSFLKLALTDESREKFGVIFLSASNQVIAFEVIAKGTLSSAHICPRTVIGKVLKLNANAVILAHNHPSGSPKPSSADEIITKLIVESLKPIEVRVLDHIIVGAHSFYSFAEAGVLPCQI